jgi:transposase, IS30 family
MERGYVRGFDAVAKAELWERWRRGESLKAIGRAIGKPSSSIYFPVAPHGGIRPAPRRLSRLALTLAEREEISRGIAGSRSMRSMARLLGHAPSSLSREINRNGGYDRRECLETRPSSESLQVGEQSVATTDGGEEA